MSNNIMFYGLPEIDETIILNNDFDDIIEIIKVNNYLKKLVIKLLPKLVKNCTSKFDKYEDNDLYYFCIDLLKSNQLDILKKLLKVYYKITNKQFYDIILEGIINEELKTEDLEYPSFIVKVFTMAPINYDWDKLASYYLEHYKKLYNGSSEYYVIMVNEILLLVKAVLVIDNERNLVSNIMNMWHFYKNEIDNFEEIYIDDYPEVKDIAQEIDILLK